MGKLPHVFYLLKCGGCLLRATISWPFCLMLFSGSVIAPFFCTAQHDREEAAVAGIIHQVPSASSSASSPCHLDATMLPALAQLSTRCEASRLLQLWVSVISDGRKLLYALVWGRHMSCHHLVAFCTERVQRALARFFNRA